MNTREIILIIIAITAIAVASAVVYTGKKEKFRQMRFVKPGTGNNLGKWVAANFAQNECGAWMATQNCTGLPP
jgi:hypothetical protein